MHPSDPVSALNGRGSGDLLDEIVDISRYRGTPPRLTNELIDKACTAYFVEL